jgi:2-polyprenyl-3-methyl-5-hydroxy-6-metoxy-1,4-benzoquinol methylase
MEKTFYDHYYHHENSHWWFRWRYELITRLVASLKRDGTFRILDAGCGTGQMTKQLEEFGEAVGLDSAREAIAYARSRGVQRLVRGSITAPPFAEGSFDCVLALDVIEHVDNDMGILTSLFHVLRPGGHLIITVPAFEALWSEHDEINHHKRRYRAPQLRMLIQEAGFAVERITYCNTALYLPVLVTRKVKNAWRSLTGTVSGDNQPLRSDLGEYPKLVNEALFAVMRAETRLMEKVDMPFGVSILAVATRPLDSAGITAGPAEQLALSSPRGAGYAAAESNGAVAAGAASSVR